MGAQSFLKLCADQLYPQGEAVMVVAFCASLAAVDKQLKRVQIYCSNRQGFHVWFISLVYQRCG